MTSFLAPEYRCNRSGGRATLGMSGGVGAQLTAMPHIRIENLDKADQFLCGSSHPVQGLIRARDAANRARNQTTLPECPSRRVLAARSSVERLACIGDLFPRASLEVQCSAILRIGHARGRQRFSFDSLRGRHCSSPSPASSHFTYMQRESRR